MSFVCNPNVRKLAEAERVWISVKTAEEAVNGRWMGGRCKPVADILTPFSMTCVHIGMAYVGLKLLELLWS